MKRAAKRKLKRKLKAQKRVASTSRRRLSATDKFAEVKKTLARMEGKPIEDVKDEDVEEMKEEAEIEGVLEAAEAFNTEVEEDTSLTDAAAKRAKYKTFRNDNIKQELADQKGVEKSTIPNGDVRKYMKRAAKRKLKKKLKAQKRVPSSSGRRLSAADKFAEVKKTLARMEGKPIEDVKDEDVEEMKEEAEIEGVLEAA